MGKPKPIDSRPISEMRNLGTATECALNAVGIMTAEEVVSMGTEAVFFKLAQHFKETGRDSKSLNAVLLYALHGAIHDIDWRRIPESKKREFKQLTAEMRQSGAI